MYLQWPSAFAPPFSFSPPSSCSSVSCSSPSVSPSSMFACSCPPPSPVLLRQAGTCALALRLLLWSGRPGAGPAHPRPIRPITEELAHQPDVAPQIRRAQICPQIPQNATRDVCRWQGGHRYRMLPKDMLRRRPLRAAHWAPLRPPIEEHPHPRPPAVVLQSGRAPFVPLEDMGHGAGARVEQVVEGVGRLGSFSGHLLLRLGP